MQINWFNITFLMASPILTVMAVGWYVHDQGVHLGDFICFLLMILMTGLAITAGYHRYFGHRTYKCHSILQIFFYCSGRQLCKRPCWTGFRSTAITTVLLIATRILTISLKGSFGLTWGGLSIDTLSLAVATTFRIW